MKELNIGEIDGYRRYLETRSEEWTVLDGLCPITISRFYRDRAVFGKIEQVLGLIARAASTQGEPEIRCWSAGCASGEEVYSLSILWNLSLQPHFPGLKLSFVATDIENALLERARVGCYGKSSLAELSEDLLTRAFRFSENRYCVKEEYRKDVDFRLQDIRQEMPEGFFHLILCRNLVFTYFDEGLQQELLQKIREKLYPAGILVIGIHESLPQGVTGFTPLFPKLGIYQKE